MDRNTTSAPRQPTSLNEQIERLAILIDAAGRLGRRSYGVTASLVGDFPTPGMPVSDGDKPSGHLARIRDLLDDLESHLSNTSFALGQLEDAISPGETPTEAGSTAGMKGNW